MLEVKQTTIFKKELDKHLKNGLSSNILKEVISVLQKQEPLDQKYRDHALKGKWKPHRECHIKPNVLLIYLIKDNTLILSRLCSHSDL